MQPLRLWDHGSAGYVSQQDITDMYEYCQEKETTGMKMAVLYACVAYSLEALLAYILLALARYKVGP